MTSARRRLFARPFLDLFRGVERCLRRPRDLAVLLAGLLVGWWVYVPLHELLHAAGCVLTGGTVERLQISPLYGGHLFAALFSWVEAGGEYAGRLAGFDTGGNDWIYLATDLAPYLLTLVPGVWALRLAARRGSRFFFALFLPVAFAPLISLTGDAYEIGALAVVNLPSWSDPASRALLLGDDLLRRAGALVGQGARAWTGLTLATLIGALWAFLTYGLASWLAATVGQRPLSGRLEPRKGDETLY